MVIMVDKALSNIILLQYGICMDICMLSYYNLHEAPLDRLLVYIIFSQVSVPLFFTKEQLVFQF